MSRLFVTLLALLMLMPATLPVSAQAEGDETLRFEPTPELTVFRSRHYRIHTNLPRRDVLPFGLHMDELFDQYDRRFRALAPSPVEPMSLYLFDTEQQYNRFLAENDIDATHSGGMFFVTHRVEGLATWVGERSRRQTFEVLQHEGFHQFAWHTFGPSMPVWLNEGLAQYFENGVLHDAGMTLGMTSAPRIELVRRSIRANQTLTMVQLMRLTNEQWADTLRSDPDRASLLYAQAWSVVYFLIHADQGEHKPKLIDYLTRLSNGDRPDDALLMAFGNDGLSTLAGDWRAYALAQQTDDVAQASDRLVFLGTGLRVLAEQGEAMPEDLDELQQTLQRYGFTMRTREMGVTQEYSADREESFQFSRGSSDRDFVLLAPERSGLPPRITAPGLDPQPTLIWYRDADGQLVQDISYR